MGHIKEPKGIDLIVNPMPLSVEDRAAISAIIADYKRTGEVPKFEQNARLGRQKTATLKGRTTKGKSAGTKKVTAA